MRFVVSDSGVYAYTGARRLDDGLPTIVFVHGAANDHSVWALQSRYFAHHEFNVLAVDLPAHGRSDGAPLASVQAIADWIVAVLDAADVESASLVGHSLGSLAALECAARHPDRVSNLCLIGPASPMPVADVLQEAARNDDHIAYELISGWSHSPSKQIGGNTMPGVWLIGNAIRLLERSRPGVLYADLRACHTFAGGVESASKVRCPALVILGARDIMAPPKNAESLIASLRSVRTVMLPECGHSMMAEEPDAVLNALRAFL